MPDSTRPNFPKAVPTSSLNRTLDSIPNPDGTPVPWGYVFEREKGTEELRAAIVERYPGLPVEVRHELHGRIRVETQPRSHEERDRLMRDSELGRLHQRLSGMRTMLF